MPSRELGTGVGDQGFFVCFVYKKGSWILHFHPLPIEHPGYKRGPGWLLRPNPRSFLQSQQLRSSKSHGKWQWLGWTVAGESLGLGTRAPSVWLQLGSSTGGQFCSLAASAMSDHLQRGGAAGISYCPSLRASSTLDTSCRLPRKSSSQVWPSTSSRRLAVDAAAPSD